jgi:starch phosphorylase
MMSERQLVQASRRANRPSLSQKQSHEASDFDSLFELALDLRWSWNHEADELWATLAPELWHETHNPWVVLQTTSRRKLETALAAPAFHEMLEKLASQRHRVLEAPTWFRRVHASSPLTTVAYFSMEFMLSEALPIYSGGLGNVAGDQVKAASDLGVPVAAVGLLYQQGYFRQSIDADGSQRALYPFNDPGQIPITPLRDRDGEWLRVTMALPGSDMWIRGWQAQVGRRTLYLLDTNDPANLPEHRGITSELYGGDVEQRLTQELVLGIGGWRLLETMGLEPEVCHLNEGHAAFVVLERARRFMQKAQQPFSVALAVTRAGNVFTTHTPVAAGFDRFPPELMTRYFRSYAEQQLGTSMDELLALGRHDPGDASEPFNMAYLAMRGTCAANAVSRLHGRVSRRIFQPLFPRRPEVDVPVGHVTNGVHTPSWDSAAADALWMEASGKHRWSGDLAGLEHAVRKVPDERLWAMRREARRGLVEYVRRRHVRQTAAQGPSADRGPADDFFDPDVLTVGFARRFAAYKRPNLLLHDRQRLVRILCDRHHPVQLVIAGKAHPQDASGQALVKEWNEFMRQEEVRRRAVFLADYDALMAEHLVGGVDVWINTPRRPWEASGTSGMKVLVNGGLNLSELDGWWAEAYAPAVGWSLGDGAEHGDDPAWDALEAEALYRLLEREVVPEFYRRDARGVPVGWVARMRESMACLTPRFSANRAVREYTEKYYLPAAAAYRLRAAAGAALGRELVRWQRDLARAWRGVRFGEVTVVEDERQLSFQAQVYLGDLDPDCVRVELYADGRGEDPPFRQEMRRGAALPGSVPGHLYTASVPKGRPAADYTPRVVPWHEHAFVPIEENRILWYR